MTQQDLIEPPAKVSKAKPLRTLRVFLAERQAAGLPAIRENHRVFTYAAEVGIPRLFLAIAWFRFKDCYLEDDPDKKYRDWHLTFLKAVKENWMKVWFVDGSEYRLTTVGQQAEKSMRARQKQNAEQRKASTESTSQQC